jgi:hypothetical protein
MSLLREEFFLEYSL